MRVEIELLEDHPDLRAQPDHVERLFVQVNPVDDELSGSDRLEGIDAADERALSGSARTTDHDHFALGDLEVDVVENVKAPEVLLDTPEFDD